MAKARREAISLKGLTYQRVADYCERQGISKSGFLEELIHEKMDAANVPVPAALAPRKKKNTGPRTRAEIEAIAAEHFTF